MVIPKRLDSVIPTKFLVGILMLLLRGFNQERRTDHRSGRTGFLFGERGTAQRSTSFFCSYGPPTTNLRPRPFLQLTTHILELATVLFGERRTAQRPTSSFALSYHQPANPNHVPKSPDPEQEHFRMTKCVRSDQIDLIRLLFFFGFCLLVRKCQPHFPGCPSGYHFLASGASPPAKGSLASADAFRRLASCKFFLSEDGGPLTVDSRRGCHPVVFLCGISFFSYVSPFP